MINPIEKISTLYHETVAELHKCTWPTWGELGESTLVVIISLGIMMVFIGITDWAVRAGVQLVTVGW